MDKKEQYRELLLQLSGLIQGETDETSVMANTAALIHQTFHFWWTGFYRVVNGELLLGAFQGPVACYHIAHGRGVCGTAWAERRTQVVTDVEQFQDTSPAARSRRARLSSLYIIRNTRSLPSWILTARSSAPSTPLTRKDWKPSANC